MPEVTQYREMGIAGYEKPGNIEAAFEQRININVRLKFRGRKP
jgi:hypothetical protein